MTELPDDIAALWTRAEAVAPPAERAALRDLRVWLADFSAPAARYLTGRRARRPSPQEFRRLGELVARNTAERGVRRMRLEALARLGNALNERAGKPLLRVARHATIPEPGSLLDAELPAQLRAERHWRGVFERSLSRTEDLAFPARLGQIVCSAILHGGLLHRDLLVAFLGELGRPLARFGVRPYLVLSVPRNGEADTERRIWYPDPVTAMLLMRLHAPLAAFRREQGERAPTGALATRYLKRFLSAIGVRGRRQCTVTELMSAVRAAQCLRGEPYTVAYAARRYVSHSLKESVLRRLHGEPVKPAPVPEDGDADEGREPAYDFPGDGPDVGEAVWIGTLRAALAPKTLGAIRSRLRALEAAFRADPPSPLAPTIAGYARHVAEHGSRYRRRLRPATLRRYVLGPAAVLDAIAGDAPLHARSREELLECYRAAVEALESRDGRRKLVRALDELHAYLVRTCRIEPMHVGQALGFRGGVMPVDANLLSEDEYQRVLAAIERSDLLLRDPDYARIARLMLILGYRLGLRRMEALRLRLADVQPVSSLRIAIFPHAGRALKSRASQRNLPAEELLQPDERDELLDWYARRCAEERRYPFSAYLLALPRRGQVVASEDEILRALIPLMRQVTGDPTLRYHHLRHSFASWTFLKLFLGGWDAPIPTLFPAQPLTQRQLEGAAEFRRRLLDGQAEGNDVDLHALAALLGHSGPDVSLYHYVHFLDLAYALRHSQHPQRLPRRALVRASGLPQATAYHRHAAGGAAGVLVAVARSHPAAVEVPARRRAPRRRGALARALVVDPQELEVEGAGLDVLDRAWRLLWYREALGRPVAESAARWGFTPAQATAMQSTARALAAMRARNGGHRHRMAVIDEAYRVAGQGRRIGCPVPPRLPGERAVVAALAPRVIDLLETEWHGWYDVLAYYRDNAWRGRGELVFRDPEEPETARQYLMLCRALGVVLREIRIVSCDPAVRSPWRARWKRALGVRQIGRMPSPNPGSPATRRWLGIVPVFPNATGGLEASYGFRYLMTMAIVYAAALEAAPQAASAGIPERLV